MAAENGVALWVLNYVYMYTNMKGAFVHVWGEMGWLRAHVKLWRAHVIFITCAKKFLKKIQIFSPCPLGASVMNSLIALNKSRTKQYCISTSMWRNVWHVHNALSFITFEKFSIWKFCYVTFVWNVSVCPHDVASPPLSSAMPAISQKCLTPR